MDSSSADQLSGAGRTGALDVVRALQAYGVAVDEQTAVALAAEADDRRAQMDRLLGYDLAGIDSLLEVVRAGRR